MHSEYLQAVNAPYNLHSSKIKIYNGKCTHTLHIARSGTAHYLFAQKSLETTLLPINANMSLKGVEAPSFLYII
ncbi:hypothetical protein NIES4071_67350 [Calothrix sp. NIES-4071]|nr:hypothetical protein NIES4071_67350 [Calothrix sp. NIES-4071]BAZ61013.1 hypothetical protein NIES4105_67310 [Calothrix sp. NIES-4105]